MSDALLINMALLGREFAKQSDHAYMTNDISFMNFSQRLYDVSLARKRSRHIFGKIYNYLTGCQTEVVELSHAVLRSVWRVRGKDVPEKLMGDGYQSIPFEKALDLFKDYYEALKEQSEYHAEAEKLTPTVKR